MQHDAREDHAAQSLCRVLAWEDTLMDPTGCLRGLEPPETQIPVVLQGVHIERGLAGQEKDSALHISDAHAIVFHATFPTTVVKNTQVK